jgi:dTDP-4-amino-4,6-dideoxygalactose transaminase
LASKNNLNELAIFGGARLFATPKPTSNLVRPDFEKFLGYSQTFIEQHQYTNGSLVKLLEQRLAEFHQVEHCVAFSSGFWALALAIKALALKGKDEIVMPSFSYRRMADIAAWTKLKPHFCDVEAETLANSAATVRPCINENTALILGVHPIVNFCDIDGLVALAKEKNIPLLFDSVESVYESYNGKKIGCFGAAEIFSMGASKLVNGFEGGYITTNDAQLAGRLARLGNFGCNEQDDIIESGGLNARLNEVHAAMALAGLEDLEDQVIRNRDRYHTYQRLLAPLDGIRLLEFDESQRPGYKNIVVEVLEDWPLSRDDTVSVLNAEMILARAYYTPPLHRKRMVYPYITAELPVTDRLAERLILPPCGHLVSNEDIAAMVELLKFMCANAGEITQRLRTKAMQ